jgi:hypothetical protein
MITEIYLINTVHILTLRSGSEDTGLGKFTSTVLPNMPSRKANAVRAVRCLSVNWT